MDNTFFMILGWSIAGGCILGLFASYIRNAVVSRIQSSIQNEADRINHRITNIRDTYGPASYNHGQLIGILQNRVGVLEAEVQKLKNAQLLHKEADKNYYNTTA